MNALNVERMEQIEGGNWALCVAGTVGVIAGAGLLLAAAPAAAPLAWWSYGALLNGACYMNAL